MKFKNKIYPAFLFPFSILVYMPYLMTKVLTLRDLTTSLVLNNWALRSFARPKSAVFAGRIFDDVQLSRKVRISTV